jgi:hypothetical protein
MSAYAFDRSSDEAPLDAYSRVVGRLRTTSATPWFALKRLARTAAPVWGRASSSPAMV